MTFIRWGETGSGKWVDAELLNLEFQTRIKVVASLTINVPADQPTIQDALNQAALYISLDGKVVISIADGEYDLPAEIKQSSNQRVEIRAQNTVVPLRKAGYTNNKANDLVTAKSHHNVIINNTGTTSFLGGNSQLNIQFTGILFVCRDADNYVVYLRNNENAYLLDCTIFGGRLGIAVYDSSDVRMNRCTFLHQSIRSMYVWNGSTVNSDFTSFLYVPRGVYFVIGCRGYLMRSEINVSVAGAFCQHGSTLYIRGGDHFAGSYNFYSTNGSTTYVLTSATTQGSFTAGLIGYAYYNSTFQLQGAAADFDMTGITGTYVARALHNSHLLLSAGVINKTARLDHSSSGVASTSTAIFSPGKGIVGNNNSLWI